MTDLQLYKCGCKKNYTRFRSFSKNIKKDTFTPVFHQVFCTHLWISTYLNNSVSFALRILAIFCITKKKFQDVHLAVNLTFFRVNQLYLNHR